MAFDKLRCQLKQFDSAWKVGLVIMIIVLFIAIVSRLTTTLDIDQDPVIRKKVIQILQNVKNYYMQSQQDANPTVALQHIGMAKGFLESALALASAEQIQKTTSINMTDLQLRLDQRSDQIQAKGLT